MRIPIYLFASALCLAAAIGACSDGPTGVAHEAALSAEHETLSAKKPQFDICHWDEDANEGAGALVHITVNGNSWDGGGDGCGGKENPGSKLTGHNGHEMDTNWNPDTNFVATACEAFCYEDRDGDGLTDDFDPCPADVDNDSDGDGVCLSDGDTCYADPADSDGGTDTDGDGLCDEADECPEDVSNDVDADGFCPADGDCDDENADVNPDGTEVCNSIDDDCSGSVDDNGACDAPEACNTPAACDDLVSGCGAGDTCEAESTSGNSNCFIGEDGGGICAGSFVCDDSTPCDTGGDCGSGVCLYDTCCGSGGFCLPTTDLLCGTPAPEAAKDLVPRIFKGQGQTSSGR